MDTANTTPDLNHSASAHRILEAALALFAEKGFDATSIREICEAAGITRPTLYYFYESKEGLYRAAIEHVMCHCEESTDNARRNSTSLRDKMKQVMRALFADVVARPKIWRLIFQIIWATPHPISKSIFEEFYIRWYQELEQDQLSAMERGEIGPGNASVRTVIYMGTVGECVSNYLSMGRPDLTPELADSLVETIFEGWAPRTSSTPNDK